MATFNRLLIPRKQAEAAQTTQYIVESGSVVIIDKFTATNTNTNNTTISVNLPGSGETPGNGNIITLEKKLAPKEVYTFPELVGQVLVSGGYISTLSSVIDSVTITASGREIK